MEVQYKHRLAFFASWYQEEASLVKSFTICFFPLDKSIEVFDHKTKKIFLRRTKMPNLCEGDFFVGSKMDIFGRQFDIIGYADAVTERALSKNRTKTFILLKNSIIRNLGEVICSLVDSNIAICKAEMVQFTSPQVRAFLKDNVASEVQRSVLMNQLTVGPCIGMEIMAENIIEIVIKCLLSYKECEKLGYPRALVSLFEDDDMVKGIYASADERTAARDLNFFFSTKTGLEKMCRMKNSTLAIIKPHCIKEGKLGKIISEITNHGFLITGIRMHLLERVNCEEFFEVYRGILSEYVSWVAHLASGSCVALEISLEDPAKDSYEEFRKFCGPIDPEIAKILRPHTLRARYGKDKTLNAIHCTDLPDDTTMELQYLFKILD